MASMAGKTEWPQSLKDFANRAFSASTDANRTAVQEELRAVIYRAYTAGTIETTDWDQVELERCVPRGEIDELGGTGC